MIKSRLFQACLLVACIAYSSAFAPRLDGRIVGGKKIDITKAPWQVSLQRQGRHFCGGSIISSEYIATAAHCAVALNNDTTIIKVRVGSSDNFKGGKLIGVSEIIYHSKFNGMSIDYDFALLKLEQPLQLDETKQAIQLQNFDDIVPDNTTCLISGWGRTMNSSEPEHELRRAKVPIVNQQACIDAYKSMNIITDRMICAGYIGKGGKDSCQGDSGGPLVAISPQDGKPRLVGIVSWGYGCAKPEYPGVYARVIAGREWYRLYSGI